MNETPFFCSQLSRAADELIAGSAAHVRVWLALEYAGEWRAKAIDDNELPSSVQQHLHRAIDAIPDSRLLLMRQTGRQAADLQLVIAISEAEHSRLYRVPLRDYADLLALDLPAMVSGAVDITAYRDDAPLVLVCTNGRRDQCCAKWGLPLYRTLTAVGGERIWQCTHIGGHRYAATLVVLPHGICYGQLDPDDAAGLWTAIEGDDLYKLEHLRGRTSYPESAQAAEYFLRQHTGVHALHAYHLDAVEACDASHWNVRFADRAGTNWTVQLRSEYAEAQPASCVKPKIKPVLQYRLVQLEAQNAAR